MRSQVRGKVMVAEQKFVNYVERLSRVETHMIDAIKTLDKVVTKVDTLVDDYHQRAGSRRTFTAMMGAVGTAGGILGSYIVKIIT